MNTQCPLFKKLIQFQLPEKKASKASKECDAGGRSLDYPPDKQAERTIDQGNRWKCWRFIPNSEECCAEDPGGDVWQRRCRDICHHKEVEETWSDNRNRHPRERNFDVVGNSNSGNGKARPRRRERVVGQVNHSSNCQGWTPEQPENILEAWRRLYWADCPTSVHYEDRVDGLFDEELRFLDETGFNLHVAQLRRWAEKDHTPVEAVPPSKGQNMSLLMCICSDGISHFVLRDGAFRSQEFVAFVQELVEQFPKLQTGAACLAMDNARIHHAREAREYL